MEIKEELLCGIAVGEGKWVENKWDCHLPCSQTNGFDRADITQTHTQGSNEFRAKQDATFISCWCVLKKNQITWGAFSPEELEIA